MPLSAYFHWDVTEQTCNYKAAIKLLSRQKAAIKTSQGDMICWPVVTYFDIVGSPFAATFEWLLDNPHTPFLLSSFTNMPSITPGKGSTEGCKINEDKLLYYRLGNNFAHTKREHLLSVHFSSVNTCQLFKN